MSSIFNRLFDDGDFDLVLQRIFLFLDGSSLESCSLVCKKWREFILRLFQRQAVQRHLKLSWRKGVASSRRIQLGSRFMAMKADATSLAVGLEDGSIELWERVGQPNQSGINCKLTQAQPYKRLRPLQKHNDLIRVIDLSPNFIVSGSWDSSIKLWRRSDGNLITTFHSSDGPISGLYLNESMGFVLFSARAGKVKKLVIEEKALALVDQFEMHHGDCIIDMCVDGKWVVTGGSDAKLVLWSFNQREAFLRKVMKGHTNGIRCVYLKVPYAMSGSRDNSAKLWNVNTGQCLRTITHTVDVRSVFFNSHAIFTGDEYTDLFLWDFAKCADDKVPDAKTNDGLLLRTLTGHNGLVHSIQGTSFGLISCDITGVIIERDFWNCVKEGPSLRILRCSEGVNCMTCDSQHIVCGLLNKKIAVYHRHSLELLQNLTGHTDHIWSVDMVKDLLVSGSWDSSVKLWKRSNFAQVDTFVHPDHREISGVKFSANGGSLVYVSCLSGALTILKVEGDKFSLLKYINCQKDPGEIYSLAVDEHYLLTGHTLNTTSVLIWNIQGQDLAQDYSIGDDNSDSIIWNLHLAFPLALICRDNETLDIFHLESKSCLKSLRHESKVLNAILHKNVIVVGCQYGLLVFWHLPSALEADCLMLDINHSSCLKILNEHSGAISHIYVDNDELITDDYDGVVIIRNIRTHSEIKQLF